MMTISIERKNPPTMLQASAPPDTLPDCDSPISRPMLDRYLLFIYGDGKMHILYTNEVFSYLEPLSPDPMSVPIDFPALPFTFASAL